MANEKRLIDANALMESKWWDSLKDDFDKARAKIIVQSCPTVDAVGVVHGKWIEGKTLEKCSICGKKGFPDWHYCPNCGADMRGETE